ncbi:aldo/keto reductase [Nocardia sp. CA-135953]|uniref:aldo/keto reductase n=1 Tax=Nocardia sp. CA-135953 TaxID=3239978 RepID=UPI003D9727FA
MLCRANSRCCGNHSAGGQPVQHCRECSKSVRAATHPQFALNWLLRRPTVSTVIVGARNAEQLRQNLGAVGWELDAEQIARLDKAGATTPAYPYYPYYRLPDFARLSAPAV